MTMGSMKRLCQTVNEATLDFKLADAIERDLAAIRADISVHGFSLVTVCGRNFRITNKAAV